MTIQERLHEMIRVHGHQCVVNKKKTKELLGVTFTLSKEDFDYTLTKAQQKYVYDKLRAYRKEVSRAKCRYIRDSNTRQAVVTFSITSNTPNCILSIQVLTRRSRIYIMVNSRSLDISNKLYQDLEIARKIALEITDSKTDDIKFLRFFAGNLHYYVK